MRELNMLSTLALLLVSVATITGCTTAPANFVGNSSATNTKTLPVAPLVSDDNLLSTANQEEMLSKTESDDGIVVAIPADLATAAPIAAPATTKKKRSSKKSATPKVTAASAPATKISDVGQGFRALESADGCCGTGCATPCLTDTSGSDGVVVNITQAVDSHRALEGDDDCCGTGCSKACVVE